MFSLLFPPARRQAPAAWARRAVALSASAVMASAGAQTLAPDWQATPPAQVGSTSNLGVALDVDASNNSYVLTNSGGPVLHRYTPAGLRQWSSPVRLASGAAATGACTVVVDSNGNAFVAGAVLARFGVDGTQLWSQPGLTSAGTTCVEQAAVDNTSGDVFLVGRTAAGTIELRRHAGSSGALLWSVVLPADIGFITGGLRLQGQALLISAGDDLTTTVLRLSALDGSLLARRALPFGGFYSDIAVGPSGEVAVVGGMSLSLPSSTINLTVLDSTLSSVLLDKRLPQGVAARRVALDAQRNVYITGVALDLNPAPYTYPGGFFTITGPFNDWMTMKLDALGTLQWSARLSQRNDWNETPRMLRLASDGAVLVAGEAGLPGTTHPPQQLSVVKYAAANGAMLGSFNGAASRSLLNLRSTGDGGFVLMGGEPQVATVQHFAGPARPASVTLSSASVRGGTRVTGTVRLNNASGAVVSLASSNPAAASVPASVTVAPGATSASFTITTFKVRVNTAVTISARANGGISSATLTVQR